MDGLDECPQITTTQLQQLGLSPYDEKASRGAVQQGERCLWWSRDRGQPRRCRKRRWCQRT